MGQAILLTGDPQSGKTTVIKQILERLECAVSGFYTLEIRNGKERKGFKIVTLNGIEKLLAHVEIDSPLRVGKYGVDLSALDFIVAESIEKAIQSDKFVIVVTDEIGPMEILSKKFCDAVMELLKKDIILVGTIVKRSFPFTDEIKSMPNVTILEVTRDNQETIFHLVLEFLRKTERCRIKPNTAISKEGYR